MAFLISITRRDRRRKQRDGSVKINTRWFLNYRDPLTGRRLQPSFARRIDAVEARNKILRDVDTGNYVEPKRSPTVAEAVDHWLDNRKSEVKARTYEGYAHACRYVKNQLLSGTSKQRYDYSMTGKVPPGCVMLPMLGHRKVQELTTAEIRSWYRTVAEQVGKYTANRAKMFLTAALSLAAEDFGIRPPAMPSGLSRGRQKVKKKILKPEEVKALLDYARTDKERGIYVAFPFLTGVRPSEQLGLLWEDVDLGGAVIKIRRIQERDGSLTEKTKTEAAAREIPICPTLLVMLREWKVKCPRKGGELHRVFPGLGHRQAWPKPRIGGGGALLYQNFAKRFWKPAFRKAGVPYVSPHSARHSFISTLQAQGIEVGLVAKLAGHANATVTLGHYTQAVRGGEAALDALERAYSA